MRVVFFGSADFAVPGLERLGESDHEVAAVVTQPDRPAGRGGRIRFTPVKRKAKEMGLPVHQPETPRDPLLPEMLRTTEAELAAVIAYGHLIPAALLAIPRHGFVNVHASLLPKYRGAAPVPHAILHGETETGVTVFRLNEQFDAGDILARARTPIGPDDTTATVLERLAPLGAETLLRVAGELEAGWVQPVPQIDAEATKAPKLRKEAGEIDWSEPAAILDRKVRAFQPWPLAYTFLARGRRRTRLSVLAVEAEPIGAADADAPPGTVLRADTREGFAVRCGDGAVAIRRLRPEGKRDMPAEAYLRGARIEAGTRLG